MSTTTVKTGLFVKEILARLTGENTDAQAAKIARKSISAIEGQVAALKGKVIDDENKVEDAEEALKAAIYPTSLPSDSSSYTRTIVNAKSSVDAAKEVLDATKASISYFEGLLTEVTEEIAA
jgi:hypothetical protein